MLRRLPLLLLTGACALAAGCGPTQSTSLIMDADNQLDAARAADAAKYAPYEFTAANAYLHKSREMQGYADYEVCIDFAQKALNYAKQAKEKSLRHGREASSDAPPAAITQP